jgi:hypothetical protein
MINHNDYVESRELRYTVSAVAIMQTAAAAHQIYVAFSGRLINSILAAILLAGAVGLLRRVRWGRWTAMLFLWTAIVVSFGALSPFHAGDFIAAGLEPPSLVILGAQFLGVCIVALACLHILGRHKQRFRSAWL